MLVMVTAVFGHCRDDQALLSLKVSITNGENKNAFCSTVVLPMLQKKVPPSHNYSVNGPTSFASTPIAAQRWRCCSNTDQTVRWQRVSPRKVAVPTFIELDLLRRRGFLRPDSTSTVRHVGHDCSKFAPQGRRRLRRTQELSLFCRRGNDAPNARK
mmetsp:Transcript_41480/g.76643  ORF Transcript_41480/g.76643 Transcript_41480/m.76643 type:complete len:156 (+) Transcript_41480:548-1015(+)